MAKPAYIYVASVSGRDDICKIGYSKNPESRVKDIRNEYGLSCAVSVYSKFMRSEAWKTEQTIHKILAKHRLYGEMFSIKPSRASMIVEAVGDRFFHVPENDFCQICLSDYHFSTQLTEKQASEAWNHAKRYFRSRSIWLPQDANRTDYFKYIMEKVA